MERKKLRLEGHDYSEVGYYFITICTDEKRNFFWDSTPCVGADIIRPKGPNLTTCGQIVDKAIRDIPTYYNLAKVDKYVIMPNHVHMILILGDPGRIISAPTKSVSTIVGQMKRISSKLAGRPLWQRSFHDHIIRNEADYLRIWNYIDTNPAKWTEDEYFEA